MNNDLNPQAEQMADESMIRTLAAQAEAIWPQEVKLFDRYALPARARIIDVGCGSGEITSRLARKYAGADVVGLDILEHSVALARSRYPELAPRLHFQAGDGFALDFPANTFDLVVCRHVTQSIPHPERVLAELHRVCKRGGWMHVLSEDYGMIHVSPGATDPDRFWHECVRTAAAAMGTDERIGRRTWNLLQSLLGELAVDYVTVDTVRVPRTTFAAIIEAWRDGYTDLLSRYTKLPAADVRAYFDTIIAAIRNPAEYVVWQVPIVSGRKGQAPAPGRSI
jgi:ubiquinone/menaquinone biosynthesis C-methylase UbiE